MYQPIYDFLISRGLTNLIDIDGLIYAPVTDLLRLYVKYGSAAFVLFGLILAALCSAISCYIGFRKIADS